MRDEDGKSLAGATVRFSGPYSGPINVTASGHFGALLPEGTYTVHVSEL